MPSTVPVSQLMNAARRGENRSQAEKTLFAFLYHEIMDYLRRYRLNGAMGDEDVTLDTLFAAIEWNRSRPDSNGDSRDDFTKFARRVAKNLALKAIRYETRAKRDRRRTEPLVADGSSSAREMDPTVTAIINEILGSLKPADHEVAAELLEGKWIPEIAELLGRSDEYVRQIVHRILRKLIQGVQND